MPRRTASIPIGGSLNELSGWSMAGFRCHHSPQCHRLAQDQMERLKTMTDSVFDPFVIL